MISEKLDKADIEHIFSLLKAAQKTLIHTRQYTNQNDTIDISIVGNSDDVDRPDPLRIPEIIIVISVLLLWCASIFIFIRHSELLRIRHRDLPYRSAVKSSINLNHIGVVNRTSDIIVHSKSGISTVGGLTPPIVISKRRHTHSYDLNRASSTKHSSDKCNDKEHFLHPHRISSDKKQNFLNIHRKSINNLHRKSMENLSTIKYSIFYSAHNMLTRKHSDGSEIIIEKRCIQESPV